MRACPKNRRRSAQLIGLFASLLILPALAEDAPPPVTAGNWREVLQRPTTWFASPEARAIAENVLLYQDESGGWPKNRDMTKPPPNMVGETEETSAPTIDNGATWTQLRFLARVRVTLPEVRYETAFLRGLDYLLAAQYTNGGWPQFFPLRQGYYTHITFNDDAMIRVLELLRDVAARQPEFTFVDPERRARAADSVRRGTECILQCQVVVDGVKTAWCAQHDETTFAAAPARKFEPASLSGYESVGIVRFLMSIEKPSPAVIDAIERAVAWFAQVKLTGIRVDTVVNPKLPHGHDRVVVEDPAAPPLWARFYELGTNRPIFTGRDGVVRYELARIDAERRGGYTWYTDNPSALLGKDHPRWRTKHHRP